jgi:hypothetical protein
MSDKSRKQNSRAIKSGRTAKARRRKRRSQGIHPMVWIGGALGVVVLIVVLGLSRPDASASAPEPSRSENEAELLPLAESKRPLRGGHDMARIPQQTPAPQPAPANVSLPQLELPNAIYDFGRIPKRPDVAHVFAVQNIGDADLEIRNLVTSCGCTVAELSSSVIPPGQRADLTVTFDPDFHETKGQVTRLVWFATNDPTQPWVEVRIDAEVAS